MYISERALKILEVLSLFKFLNSAQLIRLNVAKHKPNLNKAYKELLFFNMIGKLSFWVHPKLGRLQNIYYVKPKGKNFLLQHLNYSESKIKMPIWTSSMFFRDYFHRTNAIDFQIELYLYVLKRWGNILLYDTYYDYYGSAKKHTIKAKTKLLFEDGTFFIPDAICKIKLDNQIKIYSFEIYNWFNTKRVISQLHKHIQSLHEWLPSIILNEKIGSKVLLLFDTKVHMDAVINRVIWDNTFLNFRKLFLFNYIDSIKSDFDSWYYFDQEKAKL